MSSASTLVSFDDHARIEALRRITPADVNNADIADDVRAALLSPTAEVRCVALRTWARCGLPTDDTTRQNLIHRDARVRMATLVALSRRGGDGAAAACRIALRDSERLVVLVALHCILRSQLDVPTDVVALLLEHDDWRIRAKAGLILLRDADARGHALIGAMLAAGNADQQQFIIRLIGTARLSAAIGFVKPFLVHGNTFLKDVIQTYGVLGDTELVRPLMSFLCSGFVPIRLAAREALLTIGDVSICGTLEGALLDPRYWVQESAVYILLMFRQPIEGVALRHIIDGMPDSMVRRLLAEWLTGSVTCVVDRIWQLHDSSASAVGSTIQRAVRLAITQHPEGDAILAEFRDHRSPDLAKTLKPFYHEERLPLPETAFLVRVWQLIEVRAHPMLWQRMLAQFRRDGYAFMAECVHNPALGGEQFFRECSEFPDERNQHVYRASPHGKHSKRGIRMLLQIVTRLRGYVAQLSPDTIAWVRASLPTMNDIDYLIAMMLLDDWEALRSGNASIEPVTDVLHDVTAMGAWLQRQPEESATLIRRIHGHPYVHMDQLARETLRTVIRQSEMSAELLAALQNPACPSVALTLLPWFVDGTLPAPHHAVLMGMRELADSEHAEIDALIRQCEAAYPQHQTTCVTLLHRHADDGADDVPAVPSQSR